MALFEPAVGLFVDAALDQGFLNEIMRGVEGWRSRAAGLRARNQRILIEVLNRLFFHLHRWTEARVQIAVEEKLIGGHAANVRFAEAGELAARLEIFFRRETLNQALHCAIDIGIGRLWSARDVCFVAYDPLIYQTIENFPIAL